MEGMTVNRQNIIQNIGLVIKGILVAVSFCIIHNIKTSSIVSLALFTMYVMLCHKADVKLEKKEKIVKIILGGLFSFFTALGEMLVILASEFAPSWVLTFVICWLGQFFLMEFIIGSLLVLLRKNHFVTTTETVSSLKTERKLFGLCMLVLMVIWGIGWIRNFPGSMSRDSIQIANMALENVKLDPAVPIVYILPIRFFWNIGEAVFGTPNAGLGFSTFVQMTFFAAIVSYAVTRLHANAVKKWVCILVLLYFALMPYNTYMVTTIWKDVPFAASMLLFMVMIFEQYLDKKTESKLQEYGRLLLIVIAGMGVCLMRNNGLYAFILFLPFGIWIFWKKNKKLMITLVLTFVLVKIVQGPVYDSLMTKQAAVIAEKNNTGNEKTDGKETKKVKNATTNYNSNALLYVIPLQQMANVAVDRTDLSAEDYERLNRIMDVEAVRANYAEKSDYCRRCIDITLPLINFSTSQKEYIETWVYFGLKYPLNYVLGWRGQTIGYWYPDIQNWTTINAIIENDIGLYKEWVFTEELSWKLEDLEELYMKIPAYGMLWSIGFVVWATLFGMGVTFIKKGFKAVLLYIPLIGVWLTLLAATPIYAEFRYAYSIFLCLPFALLFPFLEKKEDVIDEK